MTQLLTDPSTMSVEALLAKWGPRAAAAEEIVNVRSVSLLLGEASDLGSVVDHCWEPVAGKVPRPGLKTAVGTGAIPETLAQDLRELAVLVSHTHNEYRVVSAYTLEAPGERGEFLLLEIRQCLRSVIDNEGNAEHQAEFDPALLDEAIAVAQRLRAQSAMELSGAAADPQRTALSLRNRLLTLLVDRMNGARRAVRFVFRHHPEVVGLASSEYQRRRRAASRAAQETEAEAEAEAEATAAPLAPVAAVVAAPVSPAAVEGAKSNPFVA